MTAVSAQGSAHRGSSEVDEAFISLYNKEYHTNRALPALEVTSKEDVIRKEIPALAITLLKDYAAKQEIKLSDDDEEELIGDETDILKLSQIIDNGSDKVTFGLFRSTSSIPTVTKSRRSNLRMQLR